MPGSTGRAQARNIAELQQLRAKLVRRGAQADAGAQPQGRDARQPIAQKVSARIPCFCITCPVPRQAGLLKLPETRGRNTTLSDGGLRAAAPKPHGR